MFLLTHTSQAMDVRYPIAAHVQLADIAHSLAQINRFTGHASRPYSVAEHSLLVSHIVGQVLGGDAGAQLAALMHDAHEAYCGDLASPSKREVGPSWDEYERRWQYVVRSKFGLLHLAGKHHAMVHKADLIALATERRDLMPAGGPLWECLQFMQPIAMDLAHPARADVPWHAWRDEFTQRFHQLQAAAITAAGEQMATMTSNPAPTLATAPDDPHSF